MNVRLEKTPARPAVICAVYMLSMFILYFLLPIRYDTQRPLLLTVLVSLYIIAFYAGYRLAQKPVPPRVGENRWEDVDVGRLQLCILLLLGFTLTCVLRNIRSVGGSGIIASLQTAFTDPNAVYMAKMDAEGSTVFNAVTLLGAPLLIYASFYGMLCFSKLSRLFKALYVCCLILEVSRWLIIGTNKGLFDIVGLLIITLLLRSWRERALNQPATGKSMGYKQRIVMLISACFAVFMFGHTITSRLSVNLDQLYTVGVRYVNTDSLLFRALPKSVSIVAVRLLSYLTHGYYGMSLGLTLEWKPTMLLGGSGFITSYAERLLGVDITGLLYQTRIEQVYGWSASAKWHTMYLWLANDLSFIGVIFFMLVLGALFCRAIHAALYHHNPFAACLCYLIMMTVLYSSANNQILGSGNTLIAFIVFLVLWKFPGVRKFRRGKGSRTKKTGDRDI